MGDTVVATLGIIHSNSCSSSLLPEEVTKKLLAKASINSSMALPASVLFVSDSLSAFSMGKDGFAYKLVVDLELWVHELNESHLVHKIDTRFLKNLNIRNNLPCLGGKASCQGKRSQESINLIELGVE